MPDLLFQFEMFAPTARPKVLSVTELTRDLKDLIEARFDRLAIQGEISNLSRAGSGHVYFTLKDSGATLNAALFRQQARAVRFELQNGQQVVARGRLGVYESRGNYQLICDAIEPTGVGALSLAFEQLKAKLAAEGLFAEIRKRPIPYLPRRIGVVTSASGAAVRDFLRVLHHRFANLPVLIAASRVQGEGAGAEVAKAIAGLVRWHTRPQNAPGLDVLVLTRGGGSLEDLWAFNEEVVARAIAACPIPVVSAVGHEVDFTISDFVADRRAPTPTAAAELLAPERFKEIDRCRVARTRLIKGVERQVGDASSRIQRLEGQLGDPRRKLSTEHLRLDDLGGRLQKTLAGRFQQQTRRLGSIREALWRAHPREQLGRAERTLRDHREALGLKLAGRLNVEVRRLGVLGERLMRASPQGRIQAELATLRRFERELEVSHDQGLSERRHHLRTQASRLDALSPLQVMSRGYSIAFANGRVLLRHADVAPGAALALRLPDQGELDARVIAVRPPPHR